MIGATETTASGPSWTPASPHDRVEDLRRELTQQVLDARDRGHRSPPGGGRLAGGILAGRYRRGIAPEAASRMGRLLASADPAAQQWASEQLGDRNLNIAEEVRRVAVELDTTPAAVALAWVRRRPGVAAVIIGPRTVEQYKHNLAGFALELPDDVTTRLDDMSGPAPDPITGMRAVA